MSRRLHSSPPPAGFADSSRLVEGRLDDPHRLLGPRFIEGRWLVHAWCPGSAGCEAILPEGDRLPMRSLHFDGLFVGEIPTASEDPPRYRLRFHMPSGHAWEEEDPYRFPSTIDPSDLYYFAQGTHRGLWHVLGAHERELDGVRGVRFATWAPGATRVSVVGDFCHWDGLRRPMRRCGPSGVFELFVPEAKVGDLYKFEIRTAQGRIRLKTDPFARAMERPPETAARVDRSEHVWADQAWMASRERLDPRRRPIAIYEVHLGSWRRALANEGYRALADELVPHVKSLGFTHLELLPITEYPFDGSWGYQVSGYYAPTARYGSPDDFRAFVDRCHAEGIGVLLDWVPAHFPRDDFALRRFDGTKLYEYEDPRIGEHPEWGTLVFDFGRNEVRNFLMASALYWLQEFHLDGLRVDAVASMLYRDYGRTASDWVPNIYGGNENLEAIHFLRELNDAIHSECPGCFTVAEESTAWPGVTRPTNEGGLGFTFKWNMGWMHDTLRYLARDPIHRAHHQDELTFAAIYEHSEHFLMPLSHDEVVHGKLPLLEKMPGDRWQQFANLRLLYAYQYTRPGKKLLFMGSEIGPVKEWSEAEEIDWTLEQQPLHSGLRRFLESLGRVYQSCPALWRSDSDPEGFAWIDCSDHAQSVMSYLRSAEDEICLVVLNLTPIPRDGYRIGVPCPGRWRVLLSSDSGEFGGSDYARIRSVDTDPFPMHGRADSVALDLPPLACVILASGPSS